MLFRNEGNDVKVRIPEAGGYIWKTVRQNQEVDLPESIGRIHGFKVEQPKVTTGKIGNTKVETKQFNDKFEQKLLKIKGLGGKTAKDIIRIYPTEDALKKAIKSGKDLPIRDDLEKKLKRKFK